MNSYKIFTFLVVLFFFSQIHASSVIYSQGSTALELANQIKGVGITITNPTITHGDSSQRGIFSNGISGANLEIDSGIILTGMTVDESFTTNSLPDTSLTPSGTYNDSDLQGIDNNAIYNPIIFEFDVTLDSSTRLLLVDYQFASEEYNEYAGTIFNDSFGFFVSGGDLPLNTVYNIARVIDNQTYVSINNISNYAPVTVNTVNNGTPGYWTTQGYGATSGVDYTNSAFFIENDQNNNGGISPVKVEYDGLTHKLHATLDNLTPGETYHFKIALADTGDSAFDTGVFINKISGLREPAICYDYAYKQNDQYLTSDFNATKGPSITSTVSTGTPIEVSMYFKNTQASEIIASDVKLSVLEINASNQAIYTPESIFITNANTILKIQTPDNSAGMSVSDNELLNIPVDSFNALDYFYTYFSINPSVTNLDLPIVAKLDYNLTIPLSATDSVTVHRSSLINSTIPLCGNSGFIYEPIYSIFNVVENGLNSSNQIYNLNTQITNRPADLSLMSMDAVNVNTPKVVSTIVAIDMIDLRSFHDTTASCNEYSNSISSRKWIILNNTSTVSLNSSLDATYFQKARENVTFRASYNVTNDTNASLIQLEQNGTNYRILNFTQLVQNIAVCKQTVEAPSGTSGQTTSTGQVAVACGNAGSQGISAGLLESCMECLYGYNTKFICSRDNFAIRPESFLMNIDDQNQTNPTSQVRLTSNYSGVTSPNLARINLSAGYNYNIEVNATNHLNNSSSSGYYKSVNANYIWTPKSGQVVTGCNDTNDKTSIIDFVNGSVDTNLSLSQVGDYRLNLIDTTWTHVDNDANYMSHHVAPYFLLGTDCVTGSTFTNTSAINDQLNGCNISSSHTNNSNNLIYKDYNITFHPYKFKLDSIIPSIGLIHIIPNTNSYIYMADINVSQDENMSYQLYGFIQATGEDNSTLSNFVDKCYAVPLDINISSSNRDLNDTNDNHVVYKARFHDVNSTNNIVLSLDINITDTTPATDLNFTTTSSHFMKTYNGRINTLLNLNYEREKNTTVNPKEIFFNQYKVNCSVPNDCNFSADSDFSNNLVRYKTTTGTQDLNSSIGIKHYYGRTHAPRYRFSANANQQAFIYYETFCNGSGCDKTLLQNGTNSNSTDDPRWFINTNHTNNFGTAGTVTQRGASLISVITPPTGNHQDSVFITYDGSKGNPYKATMDNNASGWLIYNKYDANATKNEFEVEFEGAGNDWVGKKETNTTTLKSGTNKTNRRSMW
jgi:hypothetical protein